MSYTSTDNSNVYNYNYYYTSGGQIEYIDYYKHEPTKASEQIWYYTDMSEISKLQEEIRKMKDALRIILDCLKSNPYHTKEIIEDISMLIDDYIDTEEDIEEEFITDKDLRI